MSKVAATKQPKKEFVPEISVEAARPYENHPKPPIQDFGESISMFITSFSAMGMMNGSPILNWVAWFVLISLFINRSKKGQFSQLGVSIVVVLVTTLIGYWKMSQGYVKVA